MSVRRIKKPCPGCGATDQYRKVDEVCSNCRHVLDSWAQHTAEFSQKKEFATVIIKGAWHWYPQFYGCGPRDQPEGFSETRQALAITFAALGKRMCAALLDWKDVPHKEREGAQPLFFKPDVRFPKKPDEHYARPAKYPSSDGNSGDLGYFGRIDSTVLDLLRKLWDHAARFAEMAYLGGVQDGRNMLFQLAKGELSPSELAEDDVRLAQNMQNSAYLHKKLSKGKIEKFAV
jgi:hypothetical protein